MRAAWGPVGSLLILAVLAAAAASALRGLRFDHETRSLLRADPDADALAEELERTFGSEDLLLVAWEVESALDPVEFERLGRVTDALAALPGLEEVYSLASERVPLPLGGQLRPLRREDLETQEGRARARDALLAAPVYRSTIYNRELDVVAVAATVRPGARAEREAVIADVKSIAARFGGPDRTMHVAGVTALSVDAAAYALSDLWRVGVMALVCSALLLFLLRRCIRETLVAVAATGLPPLYALGLASALGLPLTALGAALFPTLAVLGITGSVHLLNRYGEERGHGLEPPAAARTAARGLAAPVLLSFSTTAVAFLALQATGVPAFHDAGNVVALGVLAAIPVILVGLPSALSVLPPPARIAGGHPLDRILVAVGWLALRRAGIVSAAGLLLCAGGAVLAAGADVRVDVLQAFQPESRIARTYRFLEERLTATLPVDVVLRARPEAPESAILEDLARFEARVERLPGVASVLGLAGLVRYGKHVSPLPVGDLGALLVLRSGFAPITRRFENREGRRYRIKIRVREGTSPALLGELKRVAARMRTGEATVMGLYPASVATMARLVGDLGRGSLLMALLVAGVAAVGLRSGRVIPGTLLVNLLPVALVFGTAAVVGIDLDISAVAVGLVAVGLGVDDTYHVLFRIRAERRRGRASTRAILRAQRSVGRALVISSAVLVTGLLCLLASRFLPTARFGLLTAMACGLALVGNLLFLPAALRAARVFPSRT
jgi:predicted RND superfamily exporter protein